MSEIPENNRKELLELAREIIKARIERRSPSFSLSQSDLYSENRGCFVTLHNNSNLRGCIGIIEPVMKLSEAVQMNAVNAAFDDPRFSPLKKEELDAVDLEISVLTVPKKLEYSDSSDLLKKLRPGQHGVIISKGSRKATFLPQVWSQLPDPVQFLQHLCMKAGLDASSWKDSDFNVQVYEAEVFSEK